MGFKCASWTARALVTVFVSKETEMGMATGTATGTEMEMATETGTATPARSAIKSASPEAPTKDNAAKERCASRRAKKLASARYLVRVRTMLAHRPETETPFRRASRS
jgi:hypothetical protein